MARHQILICTECRGTEPAAALIAGLSPAVGPDFSLHAVGCMSGCTRPGALAFRAEGKASYLFGDADPDMLADIAGFARLYASLPDGWITDARTLGRLRHAALARIPAAPVAPDKA